MHNEYITLQPLQKESKVMKNADNYIVLTINSSYSS